jgi:N-acetyl-alpha-D-glucosaminyl L-malate synthase BshA
MRIGIVCYPTVGGSGVIATEMAHNLAANGHEVHLLSYERPNRLRRGTPGLRFHQVSVSAYPLFRYPPYDLALATRMLEVREEAHVDIFHVHYAIPHAVSAFLARSMCGGCLKFVTTLHGTDITVVGSDRAYMRPTRFALEQSDAVTAVSRYLADETHLVFGVRKEVEVIPNFVDVQRFQPTGAPRWHQRTDSERILVHASNFRPVKRLADIVRAFAAILREVPARLMLIGDGPDREHALAVASDLGCQHKVEHLGMHDHLEDVLPQADLFLSASETESFGLSMLEAMSCGVPCVSTAVGGVAEVLGETGMLTPFGDPRGDGARGVAAAARRQPARTHGEGGAGARRRAVRDGRSRGQVRRSLRTCAAVKEQPANETVFCDFNAGAPASEEVLATFLEAERLYAATLPASTRPGAGREPGSRKLARASAERSESPTRTWCSRAEAPRLPTWRWRGSGSLAARPRLRRRASCGVRTCPGSRHADLGGRPGTAPPWCGSLEYRSGCCVSCTPRASSARCSPSSLPQRSPIDSAFRCRRCSPIARAHHAEPPCSQPVRSSRCHRTSAEACADTASCSDASCSADCGRCFAVARRSSACVPEHRAPHSRSRTHSRSSVRSASSRSVRCTWKPRGAHFSTACATRSIVC